MSKKSFQSIFLGSCPVCKKKLKDENLNIIDKGEIATLCCVKCVYCLSSIMFTIASSAQGGVLTTVGILTDIQPDDLDMIRSGMRVNADDVLEIHKFLTNKYEPPHQKRI